MDFTQAEIDVLSELDLIPWDDSDESAETLRMHYYVLDDAPYPYWEREKLMKPVASAASKLGVDLQA
jgi:hypothetical protein